MFLVTGEGNLDRRKKAVSYGDGRFKARATATDYAANYTCSTLYQFRGRGDSISPVDGHDYFLEVFIIKDWLVDLDASEVSLETCNRIIQYAINDA